MSKVTIPKKTGVELCTDLLLKGKSRQEIVQQLTTTYKVSEGGVDKWIRAARPLAETRKEQLNNIRDEQIGDSIKEAVKEGLLSDIEIELILCKIISGEIEIEEWLKGSPILRNVTPAEQIQAAKTIYQKRGSNEPPKLPKDKDGNELKPISVTLNLG